MSISLENITQKILNCGTNLKMEITLYETMPECVKCPLTASSWICIS